MPGPCPRHTAISSGLRPSRGQVKFNVAPPGSRLYGCHPRPRERVRENHQGFPGGPASLRLAEALGVPVERLAEGVEDPAEDEA